MKIRLDPPNGKVEQRYGTAAVELAVVLPVVIILLVGLLEIGQTVQVSQILSNAAREGARKASTGMNTYADVQTTVSNYLTNAGITNQTGLTVTIYNVTQGNSGPNFDPSTAIYLDQLQITVTLPYANVQLAPLPTPQATVLTAQAIWFSNQDQAYPTTITPPAGN
jgi:Flp pilus assembly protein TadG